MSRHSLSFFYYTLLGINKDVTYRKFYSYKIYCESRCRENSSETSLSQNTHKEGMSRIPRDTNTEAENRARIQSMHLDFLPLMQPKRNPQRIEDLRLIMGMKSQRTEIINFQTSKLFVQSQNMTSLSGTS